MSEYEEILDLQTSKAKPVIISDIRKPPTPDYSFNRKKRNQNLILYIADSFISFLFVAPMVVSFWHGTWLLLDFHKRLFPPYATGVLGITMHMCFVLMRQFIQDYFGEETARAKRHPVFVIARRVYTYLYSCASVMQWRGCWTAFDHLFVEGRDGDVGWAVVATLLSIGTLVGFKSLTNSLATPCILILDSLDACYNIPTRYRVMCLVHAMKDRKWSSDFGLYKFRIQERNRTKVYIPVIILTFLGMTLFLIIILLLAFSSSKQNVIQIPQPKKNHFFPEVISYNAHPFENQFTGSVPSAFATAANTAARGKHSTPIPKNIQDVIRNSEYEDEATSTVEILAQQSYNPPASTPVTGRGATYPRKQRRHDPFHAFKPHDISEVNLLAVSNVRFAPPSWVDLNEEKRKRERLLTRKQRHLRNGNAKHLRYHRDADTSEKRYYLNVHKNN